MGIVLSRLWAAVSGVVGFARANPMAALCIALAVLSAWLWHGWGREADARHREATADAVYKHEVFEQMQRATARNQAAERKMASDASAAQQEKDREIADIASNRDALLEQLRSRPRRPTAASPQGSAAQPPSTGAGLAREDAEFLAGYAADAASLQADYNLCVRSYQSVEAALGSLQEAELPAIY